MPKATFFRLPKAKQQRLMDAAYQEFARAPFNEASIRSYLRSLLTSKQDPYKGHSNHDFTGI